MWRFSKGEQMDRNDRTKRTPLGRSVSEPPGTISRRTFLADTVLDAHTLPQIKMPNRDGFVDWSRR